MIRSFDADRRWTLQEQAVLASPETHECSPPLQVCPESLNRALLAEEHRQILKLVGRLRWASGGARN
ncbi:hypothetical protein [Deinococcus aerolatus]|uniref:hypothetical protein n=1 Tax=Deinococcus aerolatus TaxID=522487 RepID=UPI0016655FFA|nr:hypothetical protein [Deinococcus aerolatus]